MFSVFDSYQFSLFAAQQQLYSFLSLSINSSKISFVFVMFFLGVLTTFTPCFLSIFPLVLAYLNARQNHLINKNFLFLGLVSSSVLIMFLTHFVSYYTFLKKIPIFSSFVLLLFSLNFLGILDFSFITNLLYQQKYMLNRSSIYIENYLTGFLLGISFVPCNTFIIFLVTFGLTNSMTFLNFIFYLIFYTLGYFVVLIVLSSIQSNNISIMMISKFWNILLPISGSFLFINSLSSLLKNVFL